MLTTKPTHYSLGRHVIAEFWGGEGLSDPNRLEDALRQAALTAGATILSSHVHHFGEDQGVTGIVILSESHISIHTWPEHAYSAIDAFMCGKADPLVAIDALEKIVRPQKISVVEHHRGQFAVSELEGA